MTAIRFFKMIIAGKKIEVECANKSALNKCREYIQEFENPDYVLNITVNEIQREIEQIYKGNPLKKTISGEIATEFLEIGPMILYRKLSAILLKDNIISLHGAAISLDNRCLIFTAPSGTGKTTHILNWKKVFPETIIINGDKPLINTETKMVYGSPWCGEEGYNTNTSAHLEGIVILERGEENYIKPISFHEMLPFLLQQTYIPKEKELALKAYSLIGKLKDIPFYKLICNMNEESARVSHDGIFKNDTWLSR